MSRIQKKLACMVAAVLICMGISTHVSAASIEQEVYFIDATVVEEVDAYSEPITPYIDFVASIQLVSFVQGNYSSLNFTGHSFIIIKNTSSSPITVGHMPVSPNQSVTVGTFGNRSAHKGIWYNIEGYTGTSGITTYGLTTALTIGELLNVNTTIKSNNSWSVLNNCSSFAVKVWNETPYPYTVSGNTPSALVNSIKSKSGYLTNPIVPSKAKSTIARHTSSSYVYDSSGATAN